MSKFLHISDLHLEKTDGSLYAKCELDNLDIKRNILFQLVKIAEKENINAVFITGDVNYEEKDKFFPFLNNLSKRMIHSFIVFGDHDVPSERTEMIRQYRKSKYIHILLNFSIIEIPELSFSVFGLSCLPGQVGFKSDFKRVQPYVGLKPAVFLTHPNSVSREAILNLNCTYYGAGHLHFHKIEHFSKNVIYGRPGAIYSNWDGDGKAWPTGYIIGKIDRNGIDVQFKQMPRNIPQTRRIYIPKNKSIIVIENVSESEKNIVSKIIPGNWKNENKCGTYGSKISLSKVKEIILKLLKAFPRDIFVTPSDSVKMRSLYGYNRMAYTGKTLLDNNAFFQEFVERSYKAANNTQ